jgi:hypothetical protein
MSQKARFTLMALFAVLSVFSYRQTDSGQANIYQAAFGVCVFILIWLIAFEISKRWKK